MKLKEFKEMISNIPEDFDDYDVVYSEIEDNDDDSYVRIDDSLSGLISDDEEQKLCFMGEESYTIASTIYITDDENDDENDDMN